MFFIYFTFSKEGLMNVIRNRFSATEWRDINEYTSNVWISSSWSRDDKDCKNNSSRTDCNWSVILPILYINKKQYRRNIINKQNA